MAFIKGDLVFGQKCSVFFLKSEFLMMFSLGFNLLANGGDIGFAHGKCPVARLPC